MMARLLTLLFLAALLSAWGMLERSGLIASIERVTLHKGRDGGVTC